MNKNKMNNLFYRYNAEILENAEGIKFYAILFIINVSKTLWMTICMYTTVIGRRGRHQIKKAPLNQQNRDLHAQSEGMDKRPIPAFFVF